MAERPGKDKYKDLLVLEIHSWKFGWCAIDIRSVRQSVIIALLCSPILFLSCGLSYFAVLFPTRERAMMKLLHIFLDIVLFPAAVISVLVALPAIAYVRTVDWLVHLFMREQLRGKVVLITGASSGIGEQLAYEYAKRGSRLALTARREAKLHAVAEHARSLGASEAFVVLSDVASEEDCKKLINETINHYGHLDHLVLNAGVTDSFLLEEAKDTKAFPITIDTVFWGSVYPTYYALPYLRQSRGRIVLVASVAAWLNYPRQTFYNAGKAAVLQFFDTLRTEVRDAIGITIAMPGWVQSEMTQGKFVTREGEVRFEPEERDVHVGPSPVFPEKACAEAIVSGAERKRRYVVVPYWYMSTLPFRVWVPEVFEWVTSMLIVSRGQSRPLSKTLVEKTQMMKAFDPTSRQQQKTD